MGAANISFVDSAGAATLLAPETQFANWIPDSEDIGESDVGYGTGITFKFIVRTDFTATFDIKLLGAPATPIVMRLKRWLESGGTCVVDTQDLVGAIYTVRLKPGAKLKQPGYDAKNIEYTYSLAVMNTAAQPLTCFYATTILGGTTTGGGGGGGGGGTGGQTFSIAISPRLAVLDPSTSQHAQFAATVTDQTGAVVTNLAVLWATIDQTIATTDQTGLVTAVGPGTTALTASAGGASDSVSVLVSPFVIPATIVVTPSPVSFTGTTFPVATQTLSAVFTNSLGATVAYTPGLLTWTIDCGSVTIVDNLNGTATLTARAGGASCNVTCALTATPSVKAIIPVTTVAGVLAQVLVSPPGITFTVAGQTASVTASSTDQYGVGVP